MVRVHPIGIDQEALAAAAGWVVLRPRESGHRPYVLYLLWIGSNLVDLWITAHGLRMGVPEANPFMRSVVEEAGVFGFALMKLLGVLAVVALMELARCRGNRLPRLALAALTILPLAAAVNNLHRVLSPGW